MTARNRRLGGAGAIARAVCAVAAAGAGYPDLEPEDVRACLAYAHSVIADDSLDAVQVASK